MCQIHECIFCYNEEMIVAECPNVSGKKYKFTTENFNTWFYYVRCSVCGAVGPQCNTKNKAIELWNKTIDKLKHIYDDFCASDVLKEH